MVRRILSRLTAPIRGLHQAAYLIAGLTLASQVLALVRDRIFAHLFGAGEVLDMYYAAFKIPDFVYALVVSLVSAYVLIPLIASKLTSAARTEARIVLSQALSFLLLSGGVLALICAVLAPWCLNVLFPPLMQSDMADEFVLLARILLVQPILLGISSVLSSVTQIERRFTLFALSPVLYNAGIILGTLVLYPDFGVVGIGVGVLLGAVAHVLLHVPVVIRAKLAPSLVVPNVQLLRGIFTASLPRSLALALSSLTTLLLVALSSRSGEGGVAVYTLAGNLAAVPLSLIAASYATAAFPVLAEQASTDNRDAFIATVRTAARHIIFWSSVLTVLAIVLRAHIVRILLGTGAFDWNDTRLTAAIFAVLMLSLLAQGLILLCARAFYAAGRSWNPLFVQLGDVGISVVAAWGFVHVARTYPMLQYFMESLLRIEDVPGSSVLFIALGYALGQFSMLVVALYTLRAVAPSVARSLVRPLSEGLGAAILGGTAAYGALQFMGNIAPLTRLIIVFAEGVVAGMVGLLVAGCVLWLLENEEFKNLALSLRKLTSLKPLTPYSPPDDPIV